MSHFIYCYAECRYAESRGAAFFSKLAHLSCVKMETNELAYWEAVAVRVGYILLLWHSQQWVTLGRIDRSLKLKKLELEVN